MADSARFSQSHGIAPLVNKGDYNAGFTADSVRLDKYNHCTLVITGDAAVAGTGLLIIYGAISEAGTTAAITFTYRYVSTDVASALADVLSTPATSAALTFTEAPLLSGMYVIEFDAEDLNVAGVQYNWATPVFDAAGTAGYVNVLAILSEPRYAQAVMPTAIK
jgi:hypothetical protein